MIYKNKYGTVEFWDPYPRLNDSKVLGINLSGGTDSALLLFFMMKEIEARKLDCVIHPMTLIDEERPTNIWNVAEIILYLREKFPTINIADTITEEFSKAVIPEKTYWHRKFIARIRKELGIEVLFHGRTSNPSYEEAKNNNLLADREEVRDNEDKNNVFNDSRYAFYAPFIKVTKKWVAEEYKKHDLMEMFELTASCISKSHLTNFFTEPCKTCWWCREKKWAFGCYDGGIK